VPLPTAVWLISVEQGVGKTLFGDLLRDILGRLNTTAANAAELKGDWSDWLVGKTLVVADEVNVIERQSFYATIKRWIGSPTISIRQRNVGQYEVPATANWLFLTNELRPIALDAADRRNMMVEATNDLAAANAIIERIAPILRDPCRRASALAQLGAWLDHIVVDVGLIQRALPTALKDDIIDTTRSVVDRWLAAEIESGDWAVGQFISFNELFEHFQQWAAASGTFKGSVESRLFQSGLQTAKRRGWVRDERRRVSEVAGDNKVHTPQKRGWVLVELPAGVVPPEPGAPTALDAMRARRQHRQSVAEWFHSDKAG
jgi:phage/plasmid-associated DNA primase